MRTRAVESERFHLVPPSNCVTLGLFLDLFVSFLFCEMGVIPTSENYWQASMGNAYKQPHLVPGIRVGAQWILLLLPHPILHAWWRRSFGKEGGSKQSERAQNRKAEGTKEKLPGCPFLPRASPEGGDRAGAALGSRLMKNPSPLCCCHH